MVDPTAPRILIPDDRVSQRTQGCWNCKHMALGAKFWTEHRQGVLARAVVLVAEFGEDDYRVQNIRKMVNTTDHGVASGALLRCTGKGITAKGEPVGDLVMHNYLCHKWSGATGSSLARAGAGPDALPEELQDKLDGTPNPKRPSIKADAPIEIVTLPGYETELRITKP